MAQLARGRVPAALADAREAVSSGRHDGLGHGRLLGLATIVQAQVMLRNQPAAAKVMSRLDELPDDGGYYPVAARARAWLHAGAGELGQARQVLVAAAERCVELGLVAEALATYSEAVRFGCQGLAPAMTLLEPENPLAAARLAHAVAFDAGDVDALANAAETYAALGLVVHEAECLTHAAALATAAGEPRRGRALAARAATARAACGDAWSPGLVTVQADIPLTAREHEIAVLAAAGHTSQAIAAELFLSVRTVSNHLQSVYSKTGATGRSELAALMEPSAG